MIIINKKKKDMDVNEHEIQSKNKTTFCEFMVSEHNNLYVPFKPTPKQFNLYKGSDEFCVTRALRKLTIEDCLLDNVFI
jgi:uncharacterized protein (DUF2237 family)